MKLEFSQPADRAMVTRVARRFAHPPDLVAAIIMVESGGNSMAYRYEPHYRWLWSPHGAGALVVPPTGVSLDSEIMGQKTSWSLMQTMGAVLREQGFKGKFFTEVCCSPELGLTYACQYLQLLRARFDGDWPVWVSAYNAGSPVKDSPYVAKVARERERLRALPW